MSDKTYKCKKCSAEFKDLKAYRAHCLKCKGEEGTLKKAENLTVEPEKTVETVKNSDSSTDSSTNSINSSTNSAIIARAKERNTCRGYLEGDKDGICRQYNRCSDCWNDYKG